MHFHINNVTGIWIGNYNHLVSSSSNIPQFPYFGGYTKTLTEIGRSPFHHTFPESSGQTQQTISWVHCHFFLAAILPSVLHAGGTGGGGGVGVGWDPNLPHPPFSFLSSVSIAKYQASLCNLPLILLLLLLDLSSRSSLSYLPCPGPLRTPIPQSSRTMPWCSRFIWTRRTLKLPRKL